MSERPGTLIVLNGTSSSGKSTLGRALQQMHERPMLELGIDRFIWALPPRYLDLPLWDEVLGRAAEAGPVGHRLVTGMHRALAALLDAGLDVVADHVLVEPAWVSDLARVIGERRGWLVAVRCPLAVLEARERERKDRTLGQARKQVDRVHAHGMYDIEVDSSTTPPEQCAAHILSEIDRLGSPTVLRRLAAGTSSPAGADDG